MMVLKKKKKLKLKKLTRTSLKSEEATQEKPAAADLTQKLMFEEESRITRIADRIRRISRPYSLTIGELPAEKHVDNVVKGKMLSNVKTNQKSVRAVKRLLPKHELLTKLSSAKGAVRRMFEMMTHPYTVRGQRLFLFDDSKIDFDNWDQERIEQEMARQRTEFEAKIKIGADEFKKVVKEVADKWPDIIEAAKSQLDELFDPRDYMRQDEVEPHLYVDFGPEGVLEASTETRFMSGELQNRDQQRMRERFEAVVRLQEDAFIAVFKKAVDQAVSSITATEKGEQSHFKNTVMENLFSTFVDFRNKCMRYGMLSGTNVETAVSDCMKALDADNMKVEDVTTFIRKSDDRRAKALDALNKAATSISEVLKQRSEQRVIIRRVGED